MLIASLIFAGLVVLVANTVVLRTGRFGVVSGIAGVSMFLGLPCVQLPAVQLKASVKTGKLVRQLLALSSEASSGPPKAAAIRALEHRLKRVQRWSAPPSSATGSPS
jgi:hypothetical protein